MGSGDFASYGSMASVCPRARWPNLAGTPTTSPATGEKKLAGAMATRTSESVPGEAWIKVMDGIYTHRIEDIKNVAALDRWRQKMQQAWSSNCAFERTTSKLFLVGRLPRC